MATVNMLTTTFSHLLDGMKPMLNAIIKTTSSTHSTLTNSKTTEAYYFFQMKMFALVLFFWIWMFFLSSYFNFLIQLKYYIYKITISQLLNLKTSRLLISVLNRLQISIQVFDIWPNQMSKFFRTVNTNLLRVNKFKGEFFANIKTVLCLLPKILQSFKAIAATFSFSLKRVVSLPSRIKRTYMLCACKITEFWRTIEKIIQIIRLPIEILGAIGRFLSSVVDVLRRLEKPRRPRII